MISVLRWYTKRLADCKDESIRNTGEHMSDDEFCKVLERGDIVEKHCCGTIYKKNVTDMF